MTCPHCADKGAIEVCYESGDTSDFALCLCDAGMRLRYDQNAGRKVNPMWHVWAAIRGIANERVGGLEEWPELLAELFPAMAGVAPAPIADDLLLAAGRTRRGKL